MKQKNKAFLLILIPIAFLAVGYLFPDLEFGKFCLLSGAMSIPLVGFAIPTIKYTITCPKCGCPVSTLPSIYVSKDYIQCHNCMYFIKKTTNQKATRQGTALYLLSKKDGRRREITEKVSKTGSKTGDGSSSSE